MSIVLLLIRIRSMADFIDETQEREDKILAKTLENIRANAAVKRTVPIGKCYYCDEPFAGDGRETKIFCDEDCAEDYRYINRSRNEVTL